MTRIWRWLLVLAQASAVFSLSINASQTTLTLRDSRTGTLARTLFLNEGTDTFVEGLLWRNGLNTTSGVEILKHRTLLNGVPVHEGYIVLPEDPLELPTSFKSGRIFANNRGKTTVKVEFWVGETPEDSVEVEIRSFKKWMASIPMIVIIVFGSIAKFHVIYTLIIGLFVGGCMVTGSLTEGFKMIITTYLINAASDAQHIYL
jgi:hypothetical protein